MEKSHTRLVAVYEPVKSPSTKIANDLENKINSIWQKVELLEQVKYISTEKEKFSVAYRFMEIELEKAYKEKENLKQTLVAVIQVLNTKL
jgi:hypothetical protein